MADVNEAARAEAFRLEYVRQPAQYDGGSPNLRLLPTPEEAIAEQPTFADQVGNAIVHFAMSRGFNYGRHGYDVPVLKAATSLVVTEIAEERKADRPNQIALFCLASVKRKLLHAIKKDPEEQVRQEAYRARISPL
jgi:hypothetical protein